MISNRILYGLLLSAVFFTRAQHPQPGLLLNRLPYVEESDPSGTPPMLNSESALEILEPLPAFDIPRQLPAEFLSDPEQRELLNLFTRANSFLNEGRPEDAVRLLEKAVDLSPEKINIRVSLADSYYTANRFEEAKREYENVLKKAPSHFQSLNNLGWLLATVSDPELRNAGRALELAERAKLIRPNSHHLWSTLSQAQYELGNYPEAETSIARALRMARQQRVPTRVIVGYLLHHDRCVLARQATSLLE